MNNTEVELVSLIRNRASMHVVAYKSHFSPSMHSSRGSFYMDILSSYRSCFDWMDKKAPNMIHLFSELTDILK